MPENRKKPLSKFEKLMKNQGRRQAESTLQKAIDKKGKVVKTSIYGLI